ncbi:zf-HC2 domain-containing protein [Streptomyces sp. NBC_01498]|uniref:anti-sigma factor family protein n=1 Tax=Streptomyces sp. NBC_01498 TaxID=2975870 RepID=UPI002E7BF5C5|nr:zf-HC2 domain-containing protein [Streptomyces sp. NBC_01498]WTL25329.1 zf-HC2 domain-containing protein [Streptomyces sp. NBC_01498]
MNCDEFVELVTDFLEGALSEEDEQRFVGHLAECAKCERYLDQFRQTIAATGELTPDGISSDARGLLLNAFRDWSRP